MSITEKLDALFSAFHAAYGMGIEAYVSEVFEDYLIACFEGSRFYQISYVQDEAGDVLLADRENWIEVERVVAWTPVRRLYAAHVQGTAVDPSPETDTFIHIAGTVRALSPDQRRLYIDAPEGTAVIGGAAIQFDPPDGSQGDLDGIFFTEETYLGASRGSGGDLTFNHKQAIVVNGLEEGFARAFARHNFRHPVRTSSSAQHLYFEALLDLADEHERFAYDLVRSGKMGISTGAAGHLVRVRGRGGHDIPFGRALAEGYGQVIDWPIAEVAITPIPADIRNRTVALRSYQSAPITLPASPNDPDAARSDRLDIHVHVHAASEPTVTEAASSSPSILETTAPAQPKRTMFDHLVSLLASYDAAEGDGKLGIRSAILAAIKDQDLTAAEPTLRTRLEALRKSEATQQAVGISEEAMRTMLQAERDVARAELRAELDSLRADLASPERRGQSFAATGVAIHADTSTRRYDNTDTVALGIMLDTLHGANKRGHGQQARPEAYKAYAQRMTSKETTDNRNLNHAARAFQRFAQRHGFKINEIEAGELAVRARDAQTRWASDNAFRANELMGSTVTDGGDEWIGVGYSNQLWEDIYNDTVVLQRLMPQEWPWPGSESGTDPIIDGDVTVYKVPQTTDVSASPGGIPTGKTTESKINTGNRSHTLTKLGARTVFAGELTEDSVLPFARTLRENLQRAGSEYLESAIIDGDTTTTTSANINDIAGTPASTDYFLSFNGLRKLGLVTNTANSVSIGALTDESFTSVRKLLGTGGNRGLDPKAFGYVLDTNTYYKAIDLPAVKTMDVIGENGTIIRGTLPSIQGTEIIASAHMHLVGSFTQGKKADTSGKIDQDTAGDNTTGSIVAAIWRLWKFYWRRRMTIETQRWSYADATDIVMHMRCSLLHRDNDAAAIGYNVTV